jgi:hypothetical protein
MSLPSSFTSMYSPWATLLYALNVVHRTATLTASKYLYLDPCMTSISRYSHSYLRVSSFFFIRIIPFYFHKNRLFIFLLHLFSDHWNSLSLIFPTFSKSFWFHFLNLICRSFNNPFWFIFLSFVSPTFIFSNRLLLFNNNRCNLWLNVKLYQNVEWFTTS